MKHIILTTLLLFSLLPSPAQTKNIDIDDFWVTLSRRGLASSPLDPIRFTYAVKVNATGPVINNVPRQDIENALEIQGQIRVDNPADATVLVELSLGNIIISSSQITERTDQRKDKDGKVLSTTYYYRTEAIYTFESSYKITQDQTTLAEERPYTHIKRQTYLSNEFGSRKEAADYWNNNREALLSDFYRTVVLRSAGAASSAASSRYGFMALTGLRDNLKITDEKKHNENAAFRAATEALKTELQAMTPDIPLDRERVEALIEYFKSIPEKYTDPKLKADVRIRYAACYNLAKLYYYLDEPENMKQYADRIAPNGYDVKDGEKLNKTAAGLQAAFDRTGIHTRHFSPDVYFDNGGVE
jgi:hypothetical protein